MLLSVPAEVLKTTLPVFSEEVISAPPDVVYNGPLSATVPLTSTIASAKAALVPLVAAV